jgi:hypothetical protein
VPGEGAIGLDCPTATACERPQGLSSPGVPQLFGWRGRFQARGLALVQADKSSGITQSVLLPPIPNGILPVMFVVSQAEATVILRRLSAAQGAVGRNRQSR